MYTPSGELHALTEVNFDLFEHGELGSPPLDYGFSVKATNGATYYVQVKVLDTQELHIGWEWEARIIERRCKFFVNNIPGYGVSECMYRGKQGRPKEYADNDPEFVKDIKKC